MATRKKTAKKTTRKNTKKASARKPAPAVTGGEMPAAAQAISPPPPQQLGTANTEFLAKQAALDAVANKHNVADHLVIVRADEAPNPYIVRRPTGITELDIQLAGGFPAGGTCFVSGPDNSGKTWLMLATMAMQQRIYEHECIQAMAVTEGGFPYDQAMRVGLRIAVPDEMIRQWQQWLIQRGMTPYTSEQLYAFKQQVGDFRIVRGSTGEEVLQLVLELVKTRACSIIALDSIQGLQPQADAAKEMDENAKRAAHATMMTEFFKRYIPLTTGLSGLNETTLLMTQQVRQNSEKATAPSYMQAALKDWMITGAYASKHFKLVDLMVWDGGVKKKGEGSARQAVGKTMKWFFEKGKAGCHDNLSGEVLYSYEILSGVDFVGTVVDSAMQRGVLRKVGNKYTLVRPETGKVLDDYTAPSIKKFREMLDADPEFELAVRQEILAAAGVQCLYR
jgi:RecA/RadA recombinase